MYTIEKHNELVEDLIRYSRDKTIIKITVKKPIRQNDKEFEPGTILFPDFDGDTINLRREHFDSATIVIRDIVKVVEV